MGDTYGTRGISAKAPRAELKNALFESGARIAAWRQLSRILRGKVVHIDVGLTCQLIPERQRKTSQGLQQEASASSTGVLCVKPNDHLSNIVSVNDMEILVDVMRRPGSLKLFSPKSLAMYHLSGFGDCDNSGDYDSGDFNMDLNSPGFPFNTEKAFWERQRPGLRPAAQSPLPLTAMSGPFPVQAGTQPSGTSAAGAQTVASTSFGPAAGATPQPQQFVPPQGQQQSPWYPKTPMKPPLAFSSEKKDEELNTWLRTVPMWVRAKRTMQEEEVIILASYLEGKAAKWLDGIVAKVGFRRRMADWGKTLTLEEFLDMVEARWHNLQHAQTATDAMLKLDQRRYKSVRELTSTVENLIVVPGIRYDDQVLLTMFLRCLHENLRTLLASEARLEYHSFDTFSRKALDLEATLGSVQPTLVDGRKKKSPQEWKKKGSRLMMVERIGSRQVLIKKCGGTGECVVLASTVERMVVSDYVKDVVCTLSYGGGELNHKIPFLVSDDLPFDMLLGMYYLEVAKPQFDWDKKVLKHELPDWRTVRLAKLGLKDVPSWENLCSLFLGECHDATGHFFYKKTSANLVQRFWCPGMLDDAKKYVQTCQVCQRDKPRTQAPLGLLKPLPILAGPGQSVSMDFMDTLVTSRSGKRHIFVIIDRFTKYTRLIAMPETTRTEHVIKLFMDNWVRDFGLPKSIVSDRDVRFTSRALEEDC
ncbi:hypothetical protein CBR_g19357 [Chara braunii]|uniref:Integrase catalytic domain-containing protein n=1 Tax=Chara braunii TaxID=69332 RepID=A0A388KXR9_CHABU|nr:hypothetical protein CBR_g19357 [Chara braunii]|eukprot:GBG74845.1 hypothetical protein CBR_g19357 [Chara braunii]